MVHMSLTQRLFFPIFISSILAVILMAAGERYSLQRGFLEFVNNMDLRDVHGLVPTLGHRYGEHGNWESLRGNNAAWRELLATHFQRLRLEFLERELVGDAIDQPPPSSDISARLTLMDRDKKIVVGNTKLDPTATLIPIVHSNETVGWLNMNPETQLTDVVAIQFQEEQLDTVYFVAFLVVFLSATVAMLTARHLSAPIVHLARATRALISGDYKIRIALSRPPDEELGRLQRDFNALAHTLEKNEAARQQWIADISHELRTPIAVLRGEVEALQDGVREINDKSLRSLHGEIMQINQFIEDLYTVAMSDIGALDYRKEDLDLSMLLDEMIESYRGKLAQQQITISADFVSCHGAKILADQQRLHQLFANLFQNTLRYTDPGGRLEIWCEKRPRQLVIQWRDSAPGVDDAVLGKLFDRLFRTEESRSRKTGGAGLGLTICRNIVEAHAGKITVQHSPLGGLWFTIVFPSVK